jgi:Ca-activated chloride channel homolog
LKPPPILSAVRLWAVLLSFTAAGILYAQNRPSFRAGVELVLLNVSVTDSSDRHISNLSADDFSIFEDNRPQELSFFSPANSALAVSLLLDTSSSMEERMPLTQRAATDFVGKLRPGDVAEVIDFDSKVEVLQPFTGDRGLLETAIQRTRAGGSTALYNAVYIALRQLDKMKPLEGDEIRRQVMVVLSDGEDTSSLVTFDELLDAAKRSQTAIYTIGLGLEEEPPRATLTGKFTLQRLAQETGGQLFAAKQAAELSNVYSRIADELTSQYVLGYLSSNVRRDGGWRSTTVRVRRPGLQVRTRPGYYAPSP